MKNHVVDEMLEAIWRCREDDNATVSACLEVAHAEVDRKTIQQMEEQGLITLDGESIIMTKAGEKLAFAIIRRHRLAERLFSDILGMGQEQAELAACSFEHSVVPEVTQGLCTLLGHPHECPHGKAIPPGKCCRERKSKVGQALQPLSELTCGPPARVAYIRPQHHDRLHMLLSMGISPGVSIRVHQRTPVLVVEVDQSEFAMDRQVAEDIYVWLDPQE
ncbi:MAG: metal-dependent transcriptional regulator [Deltaproteobacteria bacterium]|nr:metal-dependent transcriptional regulator [Deltaproteobacteria bacterium]